VPEPEAVDPQFVELFIEEAREEIASVQKTFPLWDQNPMDLEALSSMRRSFHTLKGSGRMVGARAIAEFAWSIENLLNRIIDKTLSRTPGMMALLRNSVAALPQLVEQLETGRQHSLPVEALMARAFAYADGRDPEQLKANVAPEDRAASDANSATATWQGRSAAAETAAPVSMDPALHDIYSKETASHLAEIREYLGKRAGQPAPHDLPESVYRAIHTLSGSSKMAEARHGIRITDPLNHVMRKVFDSGHGLSDTGLATLADSVRAIENVVSHINESTGFFADQPALLARLQKLEAEVDAMIAQESRDTSASAIMPGPADRAQGAPPAEEFDHEIANIYSEEATELMEAAQASLTAWSRVRNDKQPVAELQRQLHTLKGGARMAGITAMGDLSHELETVVLQIESGAIAGDDRRYAAHGSARADRAASGIGRASRHASTGRGGARGVRTCRRGG
jgi:chemosensory pili system protein ChpA (sensor histidine kinase/response regulator)